MFKQFNDEKQLTNTAEFFSHPLDGVVALIAVRIKNIATGIILGEAVESNEVMGVGKVDEMGNIREHLDYFNRIKKIDYQKVIYNTAWLYPQCCLVVGGI